MRWLHQPFSIASEMPANETAKFYLNWIEELNMFFGSFGSKKRDRLINESMSFEIPEEWRIE